MQRKALVPDGPTIPCITLGAWAIGGWEWGGTDDDVSIRTIQTAIDQGVTAVDTAPVYGLGHSETVVGRAISGRRDEVFLATKCGFRWDDGPGKSWEKTSPDGRKATIRHCLTRKSIREECEASLRRLGVEHIDLYQCHAPDPDTPLEETLEELVALRDQGKIRAIGLSNFGLDQLRQGRESAGVASTQSMYNLILRDIESEILPYCRDNDVGVLTYTSMLLGLLSGRVTMDREFPEGDLRRGHHLFTPEWRRAILDMLDSFKEIADGHNATMAQLVTAWVAATPGVTTALVGMRTPEQAVENSKAGEIVLTGQEHGTMRAAADDVRRRMMGAGDA